MDDADHATDPGAHKRNPGSPESAPAVSAVEPQAIGQKRVVLSRVPVALECPDPMAGTIAAVLNGEYESGYFGDKLTILDIGANVGSFAIWATMRWPDSVLHAYEPHPETFKMLLRNVEHLPNVICYGQAVYPSDKAHELFYSRYAGDGESGLVHYTARTFERLPQENIFPVQVIHPINLPKCDIIKLDVEGGEASILENMVLADVSLILLEYQDLDNRARIERRLEDEFVLEFEDSGSWDRILPGSEYRKSLAGNRYGHMVLANKKKNKLRKIAGVAGCDPDVPNTLSLRRLLSLFPGTATRALKTRLRRLSWARR
jgi:FkbM family methyltransferase